MKPNLRTTGLLCALAACAFLSTASTARAEFVGSAISIQIWSGTGLGNYHLDMPIPTDPWDWQLDGPVSIYSDSSPSSLLATIDSLSVGLDGDPAVTLNFAVTAGASSTFISVTSSTVVFSPITSADAFATAALSITDGNGDGATATGAFGSLKAYQARFNGSSVFAELVSPVVAAANSSSIGTERDPVTGTVVIPGTTTSIQSQFAFVLSANDSASGTSRFQVNIPSNNIPEPSAWILASVAALGWFWLGRRRSR